MRGMRYVSAPLLGVSAFEHDGSCPTHGGVCGGHIPHHRDGTLTITDVTSVDKGTGTGTIAVVPPLIAPLSVRFPFTFMVPETVRAEPPLLMLTLLKDMESEDTVWPPVVKMTVLVLASTVPPE